MASAREWANYDELVDAMNEGQLRESLKREARLRAAYQSALEREVAAEPRPWWDRLLCKVGSHDWRNMDGRCCSCGYVDPWWSR